MNPTNEHPGDELRDQAAAYVLGEMTAAEKADFERRMAVDESLRREVDTTRRALADARNWLDQTPPGIERAEAITAPLLKTQPPASIAPPLQPRPPELSPTAQAPGKPPRARVVAMRPFTRRLLAAAAIFILGFAIGRLPEWTGSILRSDRPAQTALQGQTALRASTAQSDQSDLSDQSDSSDLSDQSEPPSPPAHLAPASRPAPALPSPVPDSSALAMTGAAPRKTYSENGKLVIETTLAGSGATALWVVDAGFRLHQNHNGR